MIPDRWAALREKVTQYWRLPLWIRATVLDMIDELERESSGAVMEQVALSEHLAIVKQWERRSEDLRTLVDQLTWERDRLQDRLQHYLPKAPLLSPETPPEARDSIVMAWEAGRGACLDALRRAVARERQGGVMPLNGQECVQILETVRLQPIQEQSADRLEPITAPAPRPDPPEKPLGDLCRCGHEWGVHRRARIDGTPSQFQYQCLICECRHFVEPPAPPASTPAPAPTFGVNPAFHADGDLVDDLPTPASTPAPSGETPTQCDRCGSVLEGYQASEAGTVCLPCAIALASIPTTTKEKPMDAPRRARLDLMTPAERVIYDAMQAVEAMPADVRLTDAVVLLAAARESVADFFDGVESRRSVSTPSSPPAARISQEPPRSGRFNEDIATGFTCTGAYGCRCPKHYQPAPEDLSAVRAWLEGRIARLEAEWTQGPTEDYLVCDHRRQVGDIAGQLRALKAELASFGAQETMS